MKQRHLGHSGGLECLDRDLHFGKGAEAVLAVAEIADAADELVDVDMLLEAGIERDFWTVDNLIEAAA